MSHSPRFDTIASTINQKGTLSIPCGKARMWQWFALVNAAVVISLSLITDWRIGLLLLPIGAIWPFIGLFFAKRLAIRAHGMTLIDPARAEGPQRDLYQVVETLSLRAGLPQPIEVGVYQSDEVNAFATGASSQGALVAFSTGLLEKMDSA